MELNDPSHVTPLSEALAPSVLRAIRDDVRSLRDAAQVFEKTWIDALEQVSESHLHSARNFLHYLALRHHDARTAQAAFAGIGLSSLGRAECHVMVTLERIEGLLTMALGEPASEPSATASPVGFREGERRLKLNTAALLGPGREARSARIMVTLPTEAATHPTLVAEMVRDGMDCARINCAHDDPDIWLGMIEAVRRAGTDQRREVRVIMDLPGPKIRTGRVAGRDSVRVHPGQRVLMVHSHDGRRPAKDSGLRAVVEAPVTLLRRHLKVGDAVWINDGKIRTRVKEIPEGNLLVEVTHTAKEKGSRLGPEKGINIPGCRIDVSALTTADREYLRFAGEHADAVSLSFVRTPEDVDDLIDAMAEDGPYDLGVILKIETVEGFDHLPQLLLHAMRRPTVGVMIARGDLAVEVGFRRLAEVQEEILWLAEAAHVPTIWATQVLEQAAKTGTPSRAEVTDAAMSARAEAVMLNKGPHILSAIRTLDNILVRMQDHQSKKRSLLRPLRVSLLEEEVAIDV